MSNHLDSFLERIIAQSGEGRLAIEALSSDIKGFSEEDQALITKVALQPTADMRWVPNPGPQTEAYECAADEVLFGGSAGSGKTDLGIALALQRHKRSLILRRLNKEVEYLVERTAAIVGHRDGYNGQHHIWRFEDGKVIQFGGCQYPGDEQGYKGQPKTLLVLDEASGFLESQVRFLKGWLRSTDPEDRPQLLLPTNPPDSVEGAWIVSWFAPWIDDKHPLFPAKTGKLLYYRETGDGIEWRDSPWSWTTDQGITVRALSRTYIPGTLADNPDYARTDYASRLEAMPDELKAIYAHGKFGTATKDHEKQLIMTEWVRAAQARWKPEGRSALMTSMGCDVARGGPDESTIARRHGAWVDEIVIEPGAKTPDGPSLAALIILHRRDNADIRIDLGGGWGGSPIDMLKSNQIMGVIGVNPSVGSDARTYDAAKLKFRNLRSEMWWRLREALDPDGKNPMALPPDQKLLADLASMRWELTASGILIEDKDDIRKRIGRSPDRGDAVALTCMAPNNPIAAARNQGLKGRAVADLPKQANLGYSKFKTRYRSHRSRQ